MKYFVLKPTQRPSQSGGRVFHKWYLPGVHCNVCRETWGMTGVQYPTVSLANHPIEQDLIRSKPLDTEEFAKLRQSLTPYVEDNSLLLPGTRFGPVCGNINEMINDIVWINRWTPLFSDSFMNTLANKVQNLNRMVKTRVIALLDCDHHYYEAEIKCMGYLTVETGMRRYVPCKGCGRVGFSTQDPTSLKLDKASIPPDVNLFRIFDLPTFIIATEHVVDCIVKYNIRECHIMPIDAI